MVFMVGEHINLFVEEYSDKSIWDYEIIKTKIYNH